MINHYFDYSKLEFCSSGFFPSIYYLFLVATIGIFIFWRMRKQKLGRRLSDEQPLFYCFTVLLEKSVAQVKVVDISVSDSVSQVSLRQQVALQKKRDFDCDVVCFSLCSVCSEVWHLFPLYLQELVRASDDVRFTQRPHVCCK